MTKIVQGERKSKFTCIFPPTRHESVGCDNGNFSSPKEGDLSPTAYPQTESRLKLCKANIYVQQNEA